MPSPNSTNTTQSLGVIQTVKKWFRNSWPFKTVSEQFDGEEPTEEEEVLVYCHDDEVCSVDDCTNIVERFDERVCGESVVVVEQCHDKISNNYEDKSDKNNDSDETNKDGPGGRVLDLVMASPKQYFLRSRLRKSCRFQLNHDEEIVVDESGGMIADDVGAKMDEQDAGISLTRANNGAASKSDNVVANIAFSNYNSINHTEKRTTSSYQQTQTITTTSTPWTKEEITQLRQAYQQSTPTSTTLWHDISKIMNNTQNYNRTASECQKMWFSLVATPKNKKRVAIRTRRKNNGRVSSGVEEEDDLFDSTPLKFAVCEIENEMEIVQTCCLDADDAAATTVTNVTTTTTKTTNKNGAATTKTKSKKQQRPPLKEQTNRNNNTLQSPNNKSFHKQIKSPLQKRPRMFSPNKHHNRKSLTPVMHRRKGYNTYVNNLRREINRAQKSKVIVLDDEAMNGNVQPNVCVREGRGQPSAELESDGVFVLNVPETSGKNDYDVDVFEQEFCMHDEESDEP